MLERDGDAEELKFETEDDERAFEEYRAKRMEEMRRCRGQESFTGVLDIAADSFKREVFDAFDNQNIDTPHYILYTSHTLRSILSTFFVIHSLLHATHTLYLAYQTSNSQPTKHLIPSHLIPSIPNI